MSKENKKKKERGRHVYKYSLLFVVVWLLLCAVCCVLCVVIQFINHHHCRCRRHNYHRHLHHQCGAGRGEARRGEARRYDTIQYNTIQYNTIQYDTIRFDAKKFDWEVPQAKCYTLRFDAVALSTVRHRSTRTYESTHYVYFRNMRLKEKMYSVNTTHLLFSFSLSHTHTNYIFSIVSLLFPFFLYRSQYHLNKLLMSLLY